MGLGCLGLQAMLLICTHISLVLCATGTPISHQKGSISIPFLLTSPKLMAWFLHWGTAPVRKNELPQYGCSFGSTGVTLGTRKVALRYPVWSSLRWGRWQRSTSGSCSAQQPWIQPRDTLCVSQLCTWPCYPLRALPLWGPLWGADSLFRHFLCIECEA